VKFFTQSTLAVTLLLLSSVASAASAGADVSVAPNQNTNASTSPSKTAYKDAAAPCPTPPSLKGGFYLGAQAGYDLYRLRTSVSSGDLNGLNSTTGITGWEGGVFLGYGQYLDEHYYLGAELLTNYNGSDRTIQSYEDTLGLSAQVKNKVKGTWGFAVIPGYKLNETSLGYFRLGYDWTRFEFNADVTPPLLLDSSAYKSYRQGGFDFGVGIETLVIGHFSVRTEYNHVWYSSMNIPTKDKVITGSIYPSDNQFSLGVVYHTA